MLALYYYDTTKITKKDNFRIDLKTLHELHVLRGKNFVSKKNVKKIIIA